MSEIETASVVLEEEEETLQEAGAERAWANEDERREVEAWRDVEAREDPEESSASETFDDWFGLDDRHLVTCSGQVRPSEAEGHDLELYVDGEPLSRVLDDVGLAFYRDVFLPQLLSTGRASFRGAVENGEVLDGSVTELHGTEATITFGMRVRAEERWDTDELFLPSPEEHTRADVSEPDTTIHDVYQELSLDEVMLATVRVDQEVALTTEPATVFETAPPTDLDYAAGAEVEKALEEPVTDAARAATPRATERENEAPEISRGSAPVEQTADASAPRETTHQHNVERASTVRLDAPRAADAASSEKGMPDVPVNAVEPHGLAPVAPECSATPAEASPPSPRLRRAPALPFLPAITPGAPGRRRVEESAPEAAGNARRHARAEKIERSHAEVPEQRVPPRERDGKLTSLREAAEIPRVHAENPEWQEREERAPGVERTASRLPDTLGSVPHEVSSESRRMIESVAEEPMRMGNLETPAADRAAQEPAQQDFAYPARAEEEPSRRDASAEPGTDRVIETAPATAGGENVLPEANQDYPSSEQTESEYARHKITPHANRERASTVRVGAPRDADVEIPTTDTPAGASRNVEEDSTDSLPHARRNAREQETEIESGDARPPAPHRPRPVHGQARTSRAPVAPLFSAPASAPVTRPARTDA